MKMRKNSKEIALSAVACALGTLGLTVGTLYSPMLFTGYLFACLCMMLPLSRGYFKGAALCYAAINVLTLLFNGFNFFDTLPFTMFFGLHPLVNEWQARLHEAKGEAKAKTAGKAACGGGETGEKGEKNGAADGEYATRCEKTPDDGTAEKRQDGGQVCASSGKTEEFVFDFSQPVIPEKTRRNGKDRTKKTGGRKRFVAADVPFLLLKIVWFDAAMFFVWKIVFSAQTAIPFIDEHIFLAITLGGSAFFIVYDLIMFRLRRSVNYLIKKYVGKK